MKILKKIFGGIDLTWPKLIIFAVIMGVYTGAVAVIKPLHYTSFHAISVTFEAWIVIGILIIMNSKSNMDSALKCFVFFLVSQPLVYLTEVPFSHLGWQVFSFYRNWILWTILTLPMGYIGYYMKKDKWWGYLILLPMILFLGLNYSDYLRRLLFSFPFYLISVLFIAAAMLICPLGIFENKKIKTAGVIISAALLIILSAYSFIKPYVYSTDILLSGEEYAFDESYKAYLEDGKMGDLSIVYHPGIESYLVHADFKHSGNTVFVLESPEGKKTRFNLSIHEDTYDRILIEE